MTEFQTTAGTGTPISGANPGYRRHLLRPVLDAGAAFAIFTIASLTLASAPLSASPTGLSQIGPSLATSHTFVAPTGAETLTFASDRRIETASQPNTNAGRRTAWTLLGLGFSLLAALNLAILRHLRHAYADPRKRENRV